MTDFDTPQRVEELRRRVNEVDDQLVRILNERARIVQELGKYKWESGVALFDPRREEEILRRVAKINEGPIYDTSMRDIFELIMHRIRDLEAERREFSN
ncbi:MAG: chorismate mutase [Actinomycetota bacterium]|jgi:chorismate mutase|nr:chorismate mutase [Actinomycetota bacterium]